MTVARAAERAGRGQRAERGGLTGAADRARGRRADEAELAAGPMLEVTSVTVLPAEQNVDETLDGDPTGGGTEHDEEALGTAADWLPGIRDEHDDSGTSGTRWTERPTWDRTVTPNIRKRTGQRPARRRR